jgi:formiminotetrahydrofolate cyclodeaminase
MLADKTVRELLDAFASPAPTPGGGSASALAGAISAALLAMVAAMPKTAHGTPDDRAALDTVHPQLLALQAEMVTLIDRDAAAYDEVVAAYRLPKATDADKAARKAAVGRAMRLATDVPLETARAAVALLRHARVVADHGNPNAKSDAGVAASLAMSTLSGALMNVEINLDGVGDAAYAEAVRKELPRLTAEGGQQLAPIYTAIGWRGHIPPSG